MQPQDGNQLSGEGELDRLRRTAERLALALDAGTIIGTWVWDVPADRVVTDARFAASFGLDPELCRAGLPSAQAMASIHDDDRQRVSDANARALASGGAYRCEYRVRHSDGGFRWVEATGRVELDEQHRAVRFPGVLLDIQQRRGAEIERDHATTLLRAFIEAVPGVVYAKDRRGRLLVGNRGTTELIGKPPEEYLGRTDMDVLGDKAEAAAIMANDRRIMDTGRGEQIEEDVRLPGGAPAIWLSTKAPFRDAAGEVIGLVGSSIDITQRKAAEAALIESEDKLQKLNATLELRVRQAVEEREAAMAQLHEVQKLETIGQLTGGVAHDFNNLLTPVIGSLDLLSHREQDDRSRRLIGAALQAAERAKTLVQRLLAFARKQRLEPKIVDVSALVVAMEELVVRTIGPRIRVTVHAEPEGCTALVDPNQLELALLNLCVNARDAMPDGGALAIVVERRPGDGAIQRTSDRGDHVVISVTDAGTGMSDETLARAIEPFFTTKQTGNGTGLGLSMVHGLAAQSGGVLELRSRVGEGTTAAIWLPIVAGLATAPERIESEDGRAPFSAALLVVDDDEAVRASVAEGLRHLGYEVAEAASPIKALDLIRGGARPDLVLTDHMMPDMTGAELVAEIRRTCPGMPALLVTGYARLTSEQAMELDVISKPFRIAELGRAVIEILQR